jgi:hypothetical protein
MIIHSFIKKEDYNMNIIDNIRVELQELDILDKTRQYMNSLDNIDDKKKILFDVMHAFNPKQAKYFENMYENLNESEKKEFIDSTICDGIIISVGNYDDVKRSRTIRDVNEKFGDILNRNENK